MGGGYSGDLGISSLSGSPYLLLSLIKKNIALLSSLRNLLSYITITAGQKIKKSSGKKTREIK